MTTDDKVTTGVVVNANERGFQLQGMETWLNWSKFAPEPRTYPAPGHRITASLDKAGFVRKVVIGGGKLASEAVKKTDGYSMGEAKREAESMPVEPTTGRGIVIARNPQLDREFRVRCYEASLQYYRFGAAQQYNETDVRELAQNIAAWAEGRGE